ncbi:MAG: bifunctional 4-hydroxy-2-oxoglutarate aldolase/2-dehydro-3-deoxy-phosphogluconate aldolase [Armatimonadota bacterium]|nr:bifunctional 4-hydroxy-2-oxoglutarate aldolase/2-dehydro-3-deoxy-phosphogluconate aldolase [Armatimonadota bacterium]
MKDKQQILDGIIDCGIVAVVRGQSAEKILKAIEAALEGGVNVIEITFTVPNALEIIRHLAANIGSDVLLGAGTVLTPDMAENAIKAGAMFIVSPYTDLAVINKAKSLGAPVFPGALSPTEVVTAWQAGAEMVKIFPANVMGPTYLRDLHGPLPQVKLMPTGGVTLGTAKAYLENGAAALGVGGDLINKQLMEEGNFAEIKERARRFREIVKQFRG